MSRAQPGFVRRWYRRQAFDPGFLGWAVNPFYFARQGLRDELRRHLPALTGVVLDVGCGRKPYRQWVSCERYVGLEIDSAHARAHSGADVFYDGRTFPFAAGSFDAVLCSQVFEHVFTPEEFLGEIRRVLRPGGLLLLTVPFAWDEHEQPFDFARYSSFGLRAMLTRSGFDIADWRKSGADVRVLFQLALGYLYKVTRSRSALAHLAVQGILLAPVAALGVIAARVLPGNPDLYLDNIVLARRRADAP